MAGGAVLERLTWRLGRVVDVRPETPRTRTLRLQVPGWPGHRPGQHVDVRLTAEDGYQAQRSYSIASAPEGEWLDLTVERIDDGEVSPYLCDELRPGDQLELRGPIGGYFVWEPASGEPLLLVAGGSGVVPLMAMLQRPAQAGLPDEPAADRPAQLQLVAGAQLVAQVRGDLTVVDPLHREGQQPRGGRRGDRVAALGLVAVLGGQAHVEVLARHVAEPAGHR